jgi:hypothetical protein
MGLRLAIGAAILTVTLHISPARAQAAICQECRAITSYGDCDASVIDHPAPESIGFVGKLVSIERSACEARLTVDVERSSEQKLPERVTILVGPCLRWIGGRPGHGIRAAVQEQPAADGSYQAIARCG